jgi:hypothetical protein
MQIALVPAQAHQWIHVLLVVLRATWRTLGDAPTRSVQALAQRLGVAEAAVQAMVAPTPEAPTPAGPSAPAPASPLVDTMGPSGA